MAQMSFIEGKMANEKYYVTWGLIKVSVVL